MSLENTNRSWEQEMVLNDSSTQLDPEMYSLWIHCNHCFYGFCTKTSRLYILSCHHILCEKCMKKEPTSQTEGTDCRLKSAYKCLVCSCIVRAREINNGMPRHFKELFHPTPWLENLPTLRIYRFQKLHREQLRTSIKKLEMERIRTLKRIDEAVEIEKRLEYELRRLKHENMKLERRVRPFLNSLKGNNSNNGENEDISKIDLNGIEFINLSQSARSSGVDRIKLYRNEKKRPAGHNAISDANTSAANTSAANVLSFASSVPETLYSI